MRIMTAAVLLLCCLIAHPAWAQIDAETLDQANVLTAATNRTWINVIQPAFEAAADDQSEADTIRQTILKIDRNSNINAWSGGHTIDVPIGMLFTIQACAEALLIALADHSGGAVVTRYYDYLVNQYFAALQGHPQPIEPFWQFAGISRHHYEKIAFNDGYNEKLETTMVNSLSMLLGHEMGHLVHKDPPYDRISRAVARSNESAADTFGFNLARKARLNPEFGVVTVFSVFAALDHGHTATDPLSTHPAATCRMAKLLQIDVDQGNRDPGAMASLEDAGMSFDMLERQLAQLTTDCQANTD